MSLDLVFEILCEQMPRKTLDIAVGYVGESIKSGFCRMGIESTEPIVFVTPNRITLICSDVKIENTKEKEEVKGPRKDAKLEAIAGFLKKVGKNVVEELDVRNVDGTDFYYSRLKVESAAGLNRKVEEVIQKMIDGFPLHKKMKWGRGDGVWVRPLINVACVLGQDIVPVKIAGMVANNITYGNIRLSKLEHKITGIGSYLEFLSNNKVILDQNERRKFILHQINSLISEDNLKYDEEDRIIDELRDMLESPSVLVGDVDRNFTDLPVEVISCVLTKHQRCLSLFNNKGKILKFASVASVVNERVIKTHEMVLRARLADAAFLIEKDKQYGLERYVDDLSKIIFKSELGTVLDKVNRISALSKYVSVWVPRAPLLGVERASKIAKADLASLMVREFPELQGKMGKYYAQCSGEDSEVCDGIEEHYLPTNPNDRCPSSPVGIAVSIGDKVDNIVGLMATEKISGSRDPFALRRSAISLLRVILENGISIPLDLVVSKSVSLYLCDAKKNKNLKSSFQGVDGNTIAFTVLDFCYERFKIILKDEGHNREIINCVVGDCHDILLVKKKIETIEKYLKTEDGETILSAYRRIRNVVVKGVKVPTAEKRRWNRCSEKLCVGIYEIGLLRKAKQCESTLGVQLKNSNFQDAMDTLLDISYSVRDYMDNVRVHDQQSVESYKNRINLIQWVLELYHNVLDFSKVLCELNIN